MVDAGLYVRLILKKRKMTQADLLRKMKQMKLADEQTLARQHLNNAINLKMGYTWARRIEIALGLKDYELIKMIGTPTDAEWKKIGEIKARL